MNIDLEILRITEEALDEYEHCGGVDFLFDALVKIRDGIRFEMNEMYKEIEKEVAKEQLDRSDTEYENHCDVMMQTR